MLTEWKYAIRALLKSRGFTVAVILTLSLGIGANTAIFTFLKKVVLDPLPYHDSERLVTFHNDYPGVGIRKIGNAAPDYLDRKQLVDVFESVALWSATGFDVGMAGGPERVPADFVTPEYFEVLQVAPLLGHAFTEQNATPGQDKVVVLGYAAWQRLFGGDRNVLGRDIRLSDVPYRVVGVMPRGFRAAPDEASELWAPLALDPAATADDQRHSNYFQMIARLRPGVSLEEARRRIDALNYANLTRFPMFRKVAQEAHFRTLVAGMKEDFVADWASTLWILQAAAALVLLISCVNVASLMLIRSQVRVREISIRAMLGASRWRLAGPLLTESTVLSIFGGLTGLAIAWSGVRLLAYLGATDIPRGAGAGLDVAVLGFSSLAVLASGLIASGIPVYSLWRQGSAGASQGAERATTAAGTLRIRSALVVGQIALAFILLVGSALLAFSFERLSRVNPGFRTNSIATAEISLPPSRYSDDRRAGDFLARLLNRLQTMPGIQHAGLVGNLPFSSNYGPGAVVLINDQQPAPGEKPATPHFNFADGGYFQTMGIPLLTGRVLADTDDAAAPLVVMIDEYLARKYWPRGNAVGAKIGLGLHGSPALTVVGVVGSVKTDSLAEQERIGHIYMSYRQFPPRLIHVVLRGSMRETALFGVLRSALRLEDPQLPLTDMRTMSERIGKSLRQNRAAMVLCLTFGGVAALLAAIGVYSVLAYAVVQRTREFGIRVALGAQAGLILKQVLGEGLVIAFTGVILGTLGALGLTRFINGMLYGVAPTSPTAFVAIASLLMVIALVACYLPARRATRVDPLVALRAD